MADFTTGSLTDALAHQHVTHANSVYGSSLTPTAGALFARIHIHHGWIEGGTNTNPPSFYIQTNLGTTNENWVTEQQFTMTTVDPVTEAMTATEASGETVLACASTTGFVADAYIYIQDINTVANSEWHQVDIIVSNTSVNITEGLVTGKDNADFLFTEAQNIPYRLDLGGVVRWRVIYKHEGSASMNSAIWVEFIEVTDFE